MKKISDRQMSILVGGVLGTLVFLIIYGVSYVNVQNDSWLINIGSDLSCSYIGWEYYRQSPWHFPFGLVDGLIFPEQLSITYTDSIPIAALICKIFSSILPQTFQYLGIWGILTYALQGAVSALLLYDVIGNRRFSIVGSVFFSLSTPMIGRMYAHLALAFHALILISIWLFFQREKLWNKKRQVWLWTLVMSLAATIHIYFVPMVLCFAFFFYVDEALSKKRWKCFIKLGIPLIITLLIMYAFGDFYGTPKYASTHFGELNSKLNAFFIPANTSTIKSLLGLEETYRSDWEGYAYLGAGVIVLLVMVFVSIVANKHFEIFKSRTAVLFISISLVFLLVATEPEFSIGEFKVLTLHFPEKVENILAIFRANGRFMWPVMYLIMVFGLKYAHRYWRKAGFIIIMLCLILQIFDLSFYIKRKGEYVDVLSQMPPALADEFWDKVNDRKEIFFFVDENNSGELTPTYTIKMVMGFADYAYENGMVLNDFYYARKSDLQINERRRSEMAAIQGGNIDPDKIYIFPEYPTFLEGIEGLYLYAVDGIYVGINSDIREYEVHQY